MLAWFVDKFNTPPVSCLEERFSVRGHGRGDSNLFIGWYASHASVEWIAVVIYIPTCACLCEFQDVDDFFTDGQGSRSIVSNRWLSILLVPEGSH